MKTILIKLKKGIGTVKNFKISTEKGVVLGNDVSKNDLIDGVTYNVSDTTDVIIFEGSGNCNVYKVVPIGKFTIEEYVDTKYEQSVTGCIWRHLTDPALYNSFYGYTNPYIIEYPFAYKFQDEILSNVSEHTQVYKYNKSNSAYSFDETDKVEVDDIWFNKAVVYNNQQSSGILELEHKPINNLKEYKNYPIYKSNSKLITFVKNDNFYNYNTFWNIVKDNNEPLFKKNCISDSYDKEVNDDNMEYTNTRSYRKEPLRAKELKVRHILDNKNNVKLVSKFIIAPTQKSFK